ncbi:hypothetical protein HNV12_18395 [Methanococcoides sp. SA1]|nr:hypothetical protein [Methanococcoides sp. SA1]
MNQVIELLQSNNATLFLGAGCSMGIGGPSGKELLDETLNKFSNVDFLNKNDFFDVFSDVMLDYSRQDAEEFIKNQLDGLFPKSEHNKLLSLPWKCIFTTNYDLVIERTPIEKLQGRILRVVKENEPVIDLKRHDVLHYIKMFGSIDSSYSEEGYPVLSRLDYNSSFLRRNRYYKILGDCIREGPIVFLGYSFEDNLVFDILAEMQQVVGPDVIRTSYAISPDEPTGRTAKLFARNKIVHVKGTLEEFISKAKQEITPTKYEPIYAEKTVHLHGVPIGIPTTIDRSSREHFTYLHSSSWKSESSNIKSFFRGEDESFNPYFKKWDFEREIYSFDEDASPHKFAIYGENINTNLKNHIFRYANDPLDDNNEITLLTGPAGCGKSIILKRLAFDWYTSGLPVIFIDPQGSYVDSKQVDSFIGHIYEEFNKSDRLNKKWPRPRVLIIYDKAASLNNYSELFEYLTSRGKAISMVVADRDNMLNPQKQKKHVTYSIPETIAIDEIERFSDYLLSIGLIQSDAEVINIIDNSKINSSFFALMYTVIDDSRRPLNEIIDDQYKSLTEWQKEVYEYVCLFNYYSINPNEELLVRATIGSLLPFRDELEKGQLKNVVFPEYTEWDNIDYRVHHSIIARKTVQVHMNDPVYRVNKFLQILKDINSSSAHEIKKIERFLVSEIGPNSKEKEIPINLRKEIFDLITSQVKSRLIFHHYALLELEGEAKDFEKAEILLHKAIGIQDSTTDKNEHILTSFGKLYSQKGDQLEKEGKLEEAFHSYDLAESYFKRGRTKYHKNVYSYHGQIVLNRKRAEKSVDSLDKIKYCSIAINLCEEAISNLSEDNHVKILIQEARIKRLLGDIADYNEIIIKMAKEYNSPLGYHLHALLLYKSSFDADSDEQKNQILEEAHEFTRNGLALNDKNASLLNLEAKIGLQLFPTDIDKLYMLLKKWYDFSEQNDIKLLYWYGIISFKKGFYEDSKSIFQDLEVQSQGIPGRSSVVAQKYIIKEDQEPKKYYGKVVYLNSNKKKGKIKCSSIENLTYDLNFSPLSANFTPELNDHVVFNILFNLRGIFAYDVKKD